MKSGIIGLPRVGKTALFRMLTGAEPTPGRREDAIGMAQVPDARLDRLAELFHPRKLTHATIELVDLAALSETALRESSGIAALRAVDALIHVVRAFRDPAVAHELGDVDPARDIARLEFDLIVSDLGQVEKRRERVAKDLRKQKSMALSEEAALLERMQQHLEGEQPLRRMSLSAAEEKLMRGFQFLSQKPILYALNVGENEAAELPTALARHGVEEWGGRQAAGAVAVCAQVEAEIAGLDPEEAGAFLASYGLQESGLARLARAAYGLLGMISFFTIGEDECRAWTIPTGTPAVAAAGAIHSDLASHFIRAEVLAWDQLLSLRSEAAAREQGLLRLEGKGYIVRDGDVLQIRHSA